MKKLLVLASALILSLGLSAQELGNFVGIRNAVSPEMKDGKLTLRLAAPYATRVQLNGGFLANGAVEMKRNDQGVWEYSLVLTIHSSSVFTTPTKAINFRTT